MKNKKEEVLGGQKLQLFKTQDSPQTRKDTAQGPGGNRCNRPVSYFITDADLRSRIQNSSYSETCLLGKYLAGCKAVGQGTKPESEA